jgi:hypothetical protein
LEGRRSLASAFDPATATMAPAIDKATNGPRWLEPTTTEDEKLMTEMKADTASRPGLSPRYVEMIEDARRLKPYAATNLDAPPAYRSRDDVECRYEKLSRVLWQGRQRLTIVDPIKGTRTIQVLRIRRKRIDGHHPVVRSKGQHRY